MTSVYASHYKDQDAVTIESAGIRAQFLPAIGAKMCSLVYKPLDFELLVQRPGEKYLLQPYDGNYVAGECSGFDDMFPTIDECHCETYPWKGTRLPDHGEVWSIPWALEADEQSLHLAVHGVRFPYKLEKWVSFIEDATLRVRYRLTNLSNFDFGFLWAAHMMLYLEEGCELVLPPGVKSIVSTLSYSGDLGRYGDEFPWPQFTLANGRQRDLRYMRPRTTRDAEKYYVKGTLPEGRCVLKYPHSGFALSLSFPVEQVPYLGILPNEGGWQDLYSIFIEPCTASFDRPDVARLRKELSVVRARSSYEWYLDAGVQGTSAA